MSIRPHEKTSGSPAPCSAPPPAALKENLMEMLIGDPFVDFGGK